MIKASLIISFYNRLDYLKLIMAGLKNQSFREFEIIIADDGSNPEIIKEIEKSSLLIPFPLKHVWHEDKGFRKNKILNQAILAADSEYIIFIDGDCVPHSEFVNEHMINKENNLCLTGRRINLSEKITSTLNVNKVEGGILEKMTFQLIKDGLLGKSDYVERGIYIRNSFVRKILNKKERGLLGCNFSLHKKDMLAINGFDERYEAPSIGEDSDVEFRLRLNGIRIKSLNDLAVQYHLFHKLQERPEENLVLFENVKKEKTHYTPYGIKRQESLK